MAREGVGGACWNGGGMAARGGGCSHPGCGQLIGVAEAAGAGLMRCTKCRQKVYCSKARQVAGWKGGHKQECERLREGAEAGGGSGAAAAQEALRALLGIREGGRYKRAVPRPVSPTLVFRQRSINPTFKQPRSLNRCTLPQASHLCRSIF